MERMRRRTAVRASVTLSVGLAGCLTEIRTVFHSRVDRAAVEQAVHGEVNQRRTDRGLSELGFDEDLREIARSHSEDMAGEGYFAHRDAENRGYAARYAAHDYECRVPISEGKYFTGGENISLYPIEGNSDAADEIAEAVVDGWMGSPGHRENMLESAWRVEGIGAAVGEHPEKGKSVFVTQNFC